MYEAYYHLRAKPFQLNPDPAFFYGSRGHKRAFAYLEYGLHQNEGFIVITGEVGAGKTTIVRSLFERLDRERVVAAQLVSTQLAADDLLRAVGLAFGLSVRVANKAVLLGSLQALLTSLRATDNKRALLVIDEAQNLGPQALEELRMLSNFQLGDQALLQSFLIGQSQLRKMMQGPHMQQLRQRVLAAYHLGPLDREETQGYIEHRLKHVGWAGDPQFEPGFFDQVYALTGGIPRQINTLCNRVLLAGYLGEKHVFGEVDAQTVAREMREEFGFDDDTPELLLSASSKNAGLVPTDFDDMPGDWLEWQMRLQELEERIERLDKTVGAAVDLLQRLIRPQKPKPGNPTGSAEAP